MPNVGFSSIWIPRKIFDLHAFQKLDQQPIKLLIGNFTILHCICIKSSRVTDRIASKYTNSNNLKVYPILNLSRFQLRTFQFWSVKLRSFYLLICNYIVTEENATFSRLMSSLPVFHSTRNLMKLLLCALRSISIARVLNISTQLSNYCATNTEPGLWTEHFMLTQYQSERA